MNKRDYWMECISQATEECGANLTPEQLECLAHAAEIGHEYYGMAFYSPPDSDRLDDIEREWKARFKDLQAEFDAYKGSAETAVKRALRQHSDANVGIGRDGEVFRYDGRIERLI